MTGYGFDNSNCFPEEDITLTAIAAALLSQKKIFYFPSIEPEDLYLHYSEKVNQSLGYQVIEKRWKVEFNSFHM